MGHPTVQRLTPHVDATLTCEHASNAIPKIYQRYFASDAAQRALSTHSGIDLGASDLAAALQRSFGVELFVGQTSRLLVEINRSAHHPKLWSQFSQALSDAEKQAVVVRYYEAHRDAVVRFIGSSAPSTATVLHVGVHSFTPSLNGEVRNADVGLLYDPRRKLEQQVCTQWQRGLETVEPKLRVRRNYPYRGNSDGFTTSLRRQFPAERYLGIELEVNQAQLVGTSADPERIARTICRTLRDVLMG